MCSSISTFTTPPRAGPQGITSSSLPYPGLAQGSPAWPQKYHPTYMAPLTFITGHFLTPGHHIFIHRPMGIHKWEKRMWVPWVRVVLGSNQPQEGNKHLEFFIVDFLCDSNQWYTTPLPGKGGDMIDNIDTAPGLITKSSYPLPGGITLFFDPGNPWGGRGRFY